MLSRLLSIVACTACFLQGQTAVTGHWVATWGTAQTMARIAGAGGRDPGKLSMPALSDIAISLYLPEDAGVPTSHLFGLRPTYVSSTGDFTGAASIQSPSATTQSYYWLAGVDVLSPEIAGTLVTFGDS